MLEISKSRKKIKLPALRAQKKMPKTILTSPALTPLPPPTPSPIIPPASPSLCRVRTPFNRFAPDPRHVRCLISLLPNHNIKFDFFPVPDGADQFSWVVLDDCGLVDKDVLLRIGAVQGAKLASARGKGADCQLRKCWQLTG